MELLNARLVTVRILRVLSYLVWFWIIISLIILILGFFLKLFAANPDAAFAEWAYRNLARTMEPFRGIFPAEEIGDNGSVLDVSILFAMIIYGIVGVAFRALIDWLTSRMHRLEHDVTDLEAHQIADAAVAGIAPPSDGMMP